MNQTALGILVDDKQVSDLLEQKSGARAIVRSACNLCLFLTFLFLYTFIALGEPLDVMRAFESHLRNRFDLDAPTPLREVDSISSFWQYTTNSFFPALYGNDTAIYTYPGAVPAQSLPIEGATQLLGVVRLRMQRVKSGEGCTVASSWSDYFTESNCYGPYSEESEVKSSYGPKDVEGQHLFTYNSADGLEYDGDFADYGPGGYMQVFNSNYTGSLETLRQLTDEGWLDQSTRVVWIEFTVYNFNVALYAVCQMTFEVAPSSRWKKHFEITILQQRHLSALGFGSTEEWVMLILEAMVVIFVIRYISEELSELLECEGEGMNPCRHVTIQWDYWYDGWNILDWANLILIIMVLVIRIQTWGKGKSLSVYVGPAEGAGVDAFTDYSEVADNVNQIRALTAFNIILTWVKAVKYINIIPFVSTFMLTVNHAGPLLLSFSAVFILIIVGFILGFTVAFGTNLAQFRTTWQTYTFVLRAFLGNADMSILYDTSAFFGSILTIMFIVGIFFIVMNLFYAIMISALSDAKQQNDAKQAKQNKKMREQLEGFVQELARITNFERRYRTGVPGLYSRMKKRQAAQRKLEYLRDEKFAERERAKEPQLSIEAALGPASPMAGRRQQKVHRSSNPAEDENVADDVSEPDLGPLWSMEDLVPEDPIPNAGESQLMLMDGGEEPGANLDDAGIQLVVDATKHVASGIVERTRGARNLVVTEMGESRTVLQGIGNVLEVLGRRARDLEAQQEDLLRQHQIQY